MPRDTRRQQEPSPEDIAKFEAACRKLKDPDDPKEYAQWAQSAQLMSDRGWKPSQVLGKLWEVRPEYKSEDLNPQQAEEILLNEQTERQARARIVTTSNIPPLMSELEFHAALIQQAAITGQQVVVRNTVPHPESLPPTIPQASFRRPFYLDPLGMSAFLIAQNKDSNPQRDSRPPRK